MAAKIVNIVNYTPKSSDVFFFDNNIWMYLFCPLARYNQTKQKYYSAFLQRITSSRSTIFICSLVLSEFANKYFRMDFEQWKSESGILICEYKKDYVGTHRYIETSLEICSNIKKILGICEKSSDNFNAVEISNVLKHLANIDFNDSYYIELAKIGNWKIVTDDSDFIRYDKHDIEIITYQK